VSTGLWVRWSWRDLRKRVTQVAAIAVIVALGAGIYAGLASTSAWRRQSLDLTFARLAAHDLEVTTAAGLGLPSAKLLGAVQSAGGNQLTAAEGRFVVDLPVRAGGQGQIPAAGVIVGVDLARGVEVDRWKVTAGRSLGSQDASGSSVLLDEHFAAQHHLPPSGSLTIGGLTVAYVGTVLEPEYLNLTSILGATIQGAATRAVIFAPITLVQRLGGAPGEINDVVALTRHGSDPRQVARSLTSALNATLQDVATTVTVRRDAPATRALYDEITSEQRIFDVFALLVLGGAGFAAFNLTRRVVESQRRDIGIAMSLGVPTRQITIRPLALAAEVAIAGTVLGVVAGWLIGAWVLAIIKTRFPLPFWQTPWQGHLFVVAAALGLAIPLAGSFYPVWRAVRVTPTYALLPPHLRGGRHRLAALLRRLRLPGTTLAQAPLRRITVAPTRSVMTVLAVGVILAPLLAALGATDSTRATLDAGTRTLSGVHGDRLLVDLAGYQPAHSVTVTSITGSPLVRQSALGFNTGGYLLRGNTTVEVSISMVDLSDPLAVPSDVAARRLAPGGIVISAKAASDLGVGTGRTVELRHPLRQGTGYRFVDTAVPVRAVISSPYRFIAYMDLKDEKMMGLQDIVNVATLVPRPGVSMDELQRFTSSLPGVASALAASSLLGTMRDTLSIVTELFVILQIVIGVLAFLVAYNSSKVESDERAREHATMMAFGIGVPRVVFVGVIESLLLGLAGTAVGLGLGLAVLQWILDLVFPAAVPQLAVLRSVTTSSFVVTALIGLAATSTAPTLVARRLRRMNLPGTLRYVE